MARCLRNGRSHWVEQGVGGRSRIRQFIKSVVKLFLQVCGLFETSIPASIALLSDYLPELESQLAMGSNG